MTCAALKYRCAVWERTHAQSEEHLGGLTFKNEEMHNTCMEISFVQQETRMCTSELLFHAGTNIQFQTCAGDSAAPPVALLTT